MIIFLGYLATFLSLLGNLFVVYKKRYGFVLWNVSNIIWIGLAIESKVHSQIIMFGVYSIINIIAFIKWRKDDGKN